MNKDKVFKEPIEKMFEFDVKSVSKRQLLVVCSHVGLLSNVGNKI